MINRQKLQQAISAKGYTVTAFAKALHLSRSGLYRKLNNGVLRSDEMEAMITLLEMENPCAVFFDSEGT